MKASPKLTLSVSRGTVDAWRRIAVDLGYLVASGPFAHQGNISGLMSGIVSGSVDLGQLREALGRARAKETLT